ncbi:hypothetical protein AGMMS50268_08930 [Spirochaetia bacterium]|nr:hypothetical protein AGMMS50268_08930 [Spirochaetia bacterium]
MKKVTVNWAGKKVFFVCLAAILAAGIVSAQEQTIGTVQTSFTAQHWDALFNKKVVDTKAYSTLLEAAQQKYGATVDVRDIVWTKGQGLDAQNSEILASGKIMQIPAEEAANNVVRTTFAASIWDTMFNKKAVTTQAYIRLLDAAQQKHPGTVDIQNIVWKTSGKAGDQNREIFATGAAIQAPAGEIVNGVVQTSFTAQSWDSAFNKKAVTTQAYIKLLEAARQRYPGVVDIQDIVWVTGRSEDPQNSEVIATGKVVQAN